MPPSTILTRVDRWKAVAGEWFFYVTFACGHQTHYTRLFETKKYADRFADNPHICVRDRGRVTFKKTYTFAGWKWR